MESVIENTVRKTEELEQAARTWPEKARSIKIVDTVGYVRAGEMLVGIRDLQREIDQAFDPIIKAAHNANKTAVAQKKQAEGPLCEAERILKGGMAVYHAEQERKRQAEEARLRELARKDADDRAMREALAAEADGDDALAEEIISAPIVAPPVIVATSTPKVDGVSFRETWKFRIVNPALVPREYLMIDEVKIGQVVLALKGWAGIPGIEAYPEKSTAVR